MRLTMGFSARCRRTVLTTGLMAVGLLGLTVPEARADIQIGNDFTDSVAGPPTWLWVYQVSFSPGEKIGSLSNFTIYDFDGFVPSTNSQPSGWSFTSAPLGTTPMSTEPDDGTIPNLTWTYSGPTIPGAAQDTQLGMFSAQSIYSFDTNIPGYYAAATYADGSTSTTPDHFNQNSGILVPSNPGTVVPEPGSMVLLATGLFGMAAIIRRKQKSQN